MAVLATHMLCDSAFKRHWKSVYTIHQANRNRWDFNNARECEWNKKTNAHTQQQQQNREREKESARVCMFVCLPVCMHTKVTGLKYCRKACGMIFSSRFQLCACVHISMEKCWIVEQLQYKATYACAYVLMIYVNKTHSHTRCSVCVHVCIFMCSIRVAVNEIMTKFFFGKDGTSMIFFLLFLKGWIFYYHRFIYFFMKILGECVFFSSASWWTYSNWCRKRESERKRDSFRSVHRVYSLLAHAQLIEILLYTVKTTTVIAIAITDLVLFYVKRRTISLKRIHLGGACGSDS